MGKCPECGAWDALDPFRVEEPESGSVSGGAGWGGEASGASPATAQSIDEIAPLPNARISSGIHELDRCLGGGLVPGSAILLGGEPGIGKSTLLLQALAGLAAGGKRVLYATSEESAQQVKLRAERVIGSAAGRKDLYLLAESSMARILEQAHKIKPVAIAIDSIQLVYRHDIDSLPGSPSQIRRCGIDLVQYAKASGCIALLVGHVTKEGDLAGPKLLEHLVDVVLSFDGDHHHAHRIVRAVKNRFGSTQEIGLFEMTAQGLSAADEGWFVETGAPQRPGLCVFPALAGSRCILAEVQALTASGFLGNTKRRANGVDGNRLAMLIAVLEKHGGLRLADQDIFVASAGGLRLDEPACDLAICGAVAGAFLGRTLPRGMALVGEVGLGGETRSVRSIGQRCSEALRRGCTSIAVPERQTDLVRNLRADIVPIANIQSAINLLEAVKR